MKYISLPGAGLLTGLAQMLTHYNLNVEDLDIALGMEAPYLLVRNGENYAAGSSLYRPEWLAIYLQPHGFRLIENTLSKEDVPAFLRQHSPAMLKLEVAKGTNHPLVFKGYENGRYSFVNIKPANSPEPDSVSLSAPMLKRRLADQVTIMTLEKCEPSAVDPVPYLIHSLYNLRDYRQALLTAREYTVTQDELYRELHEPTFRAIIQEMYPLSLLINDRTLAEELRSLRHNYMHMFYSKQTDRVLLSDWLSQTSIKKCTAWMREDIIDRLFELGVAEELIDSIKLDLTKKS